MQVRLLKRIEVNLIRGSCFFCYQQLEYPTDISEGCIGEVIASYKNPERYDITFGKGIYLATNVPKEYIEFI